jgi:hypothetical protein
VWSEIIYFPGGGQLTDDLEMVRRRALEIRKHYNSYDEVFDARRHLANGELKACVRSAASAVDALLRYHCAQWDVPFPRKPKPFDDKIEEILRSAGKPSYRVADRGNLETLLDLYRARNSMHEGDCYFKDDSGRVVKIRRGNQAEAFVDAVERFLVWIDSLV